MAFNLLAGGMTKEIKSNAVALYFFYHSAVTRVNLSNLLLKIVCVFDFSDQIIFLYSHLSCKTLTGRVINEAYNFYCLKTLRTVPQRVC